MARYVSFRDFDWLLLVFVLLICGLGVMEIRSATMHTKFAGAHVKQMYWIIGGVGAMFLVSLVNYQALLDQIHWFYIAGVASLMAVLVFGTKALGARRWIKMPGGNSLSAFGVGQAHPHSRGRQVFCRHAPARTHLAGLHEGRSDRRHPHAHGSEAARSRHGPDVSSDRDDGQFLGGLQWRQGLTVALLAVIGDWRGVLCSTGSRFEVVSEAAADQLSGSRIRIRRARGIKLSNP